MKAKALHDLYESTMRTSARAQNVLLLLGMPSKSEIRKMDSRKIWRIRGCGLKTMQEICRWAGRDAPVSYFDEEPYEKKKPKTKEERRAGYYANWLKKRGWSVIAPSKKN